ncbi:MAG: hypothetical protein IJB11_00085 [Oscillospiraceae bacterium]|nr:hypothetical protein [Oscillospiraceae bacterium]
MFTPKNMGTALQPWEYLPAAAGTYKAGQLLNASGGKLAPVSAAATTTPTYLCMADITAIDGQVIPVAAVVKNDIYVTHLSAEAADAKIGTKLQVSAGGLQVDGSAAGSFEVTYLEDTAAGSEVCGRFH